MQIGFRDRKPASIRDALRGRAAARIAVADAREKFPDLLLGLFNPVDQIDLDRRQLAVPR